MCRMSPALVVRDSYLNIEMSISELVQYVLVFLSSEFITYPTGQLCDRIYWGGESVSLYRLRAGNYTALRRMVTLW